MSKAATKALIDEKINGNGVQAIAGPVLNNVLNTMVDDYGTQDEVSQLAQKIDEFAQGKFYGYFGEAGELPAGDIPGFAYVGTEPPFAIYNYDGETWTDSGLTVNGIPVGNGEDIDFNADGLLQFANRAYDSDNPNGMGYVILRKNKTFAEQVTEENSIYEIRYDFDLDGETVSMPTGCVLKFEGGILKNGEIVGNKTDIKVSHVKIFALDLHLTGTWLIQESFPEWYGAIIGTSISSQEASDNADAIEMALSIPCNKLVLNGLYGVSKPIGITDRVQVIMGRHAIQAQRFGVYATSEFLSVVFDGNTITGLFYPKSVAGIPIIFQDVWLSGGYHAATCVSQFPGHFVGIRMYRCYVFRFYEAGVIFNSSDCNSLFETIIQFCNVGVAGEGKKIDYDTPLVAPTTVLSRPNHTTITNCQFHRNNVGVVFNYCSDLLLSDNLFGYNSLCTMCLYECHVVNIKGNYIEGDCNYKFKIYKDRVGDPPSNAEISTGQEVEQGLLDMDVPYRSYFRVTNSKVWVDELFNSNYYIRCYLGADGNNFNNTDISGFDSVFFLIGVETSLQIGGMKNSDSMRIGGVAVGNSYDILTFDSNSNKGIISINSNTMLKYRNIETPFNTDYIRGMQTDAFVVNSITPFVSETDDGKVRQCINPTDYSWNFFQFFNYTHKYRDIDFYKIQVNNQQRNTLRIDFTTLQDSVTYKIEIWYYKFSQLAYNVQAYYSDGTSETIKLNSGTSGLGYKKQIFYFTKNQFVREGKTCTYIYVTNTTITNSSYPAEISTIRLYIVGNPNPIYMTNNLIGAYRPTPNSNEMVVFYDTTLGKPILWKGSAWVNMDGSAL